MDLLKGCSDHFIQNKLLGIFIIIPPPCAIYLLLGHCSIQNRCERFFFLNRKPVNRELTLLICYICAYVNYEDTLTLVNMFGTSASVLNMVSLGVHK